MIILSRKNMDTGAYASQAIGVWIPLIVGLTPGFIYWLVITAMKSKK
ncbi:MAG: hypothetical protein HW420_271 [Candidatus Nitrosotenuis sp.]|nr:hypothetical protein [Candidatus Nitrosotenuis sp.]